MNTPLPHTVPVGKVTYFQILLTTQRIKLTMVDVSNGILTCPPKQETERKYLCFLKSRTTGNTSFHMEFKKSSLYIVHELK